MGASLYDVLNVTNTASSEEIKKVCAIFYLCSWLPLRVSPDVSAYAQTALRRASSPQIAFPLLELCLSASLRQAYHDLALRWHPVRA